MTPTQNDARFHNVVCAIASLIPSERVRGNVLIPVCKAYLGCDQLRAMDDFHAVFTTYEDLLAFAKQISNGRLYSVGSLQGVLADHGYTAEAKAVDLQKRTRHGLCHPLSSASFRNIQCALTSIYLPKPPGAWTVDAKQHCGDEQHADNRDYDMQQSDSNKEQHYYDKQHDTSSDYDKQQSARDKKQHYGDEQRDKSRDFYEQPSARVKKHHYGGDQHHGEEQHHNSFGFNEQQSDSDKKQRYRDAYSPPSTPRSSTPRGCRSPRNSSSPSRSLESIFSEWRERKKSRRSNLGKGSNRNGVHALKAWKSRDGEFIKELELEEFDPGFNFKKRLIGSSGRNLRHIEDTSHSIVEIDQSHVDGPIFITVISSNREDTDYGIKLCQDLVFSIMDVYFEWLDD